MTSLGTFGKPWLAALGGLLFSGSVLAQDIPGLESATDETIRSACHGYLADMLPEDWRDDAYELTRRCDPRARGDARADPAAAPPPTVPGGPAVELGQRRERDLDITIECRNEYMCMEQRVRLRNARTPISQPDYDRVASHCDQHYACIESFLRDWPKPLPAATQAQAGLGFTFDGLAADSGDRSGSGPEELTARPGPVPPPEDTAQGSAGLGFDGLETHRQQEKNQRLGEAAWKEAYDTATGKSLTRLLNEQCGRIDLGYRTPASPRTIREDMRSMKDRYTRYSTCYGRVAGRWDAQAYADALAGYGQRIGAIEQQTGVDLSGKRRPRGIDQEVAAMQQHLEETAGKLRSQLKSGPEWIESLYASGTYKRPNSGPGAMAILAQSLAHINNSLAQENARRQTDLDALLRSVTVPRVEAPRINAPRVGTPRIDVPRVAVSRPSATPGGAVSGPPARDTAVGEVASFGCYAPGLQVCIDYTMPGRELEPYRQRCRSQGNQVLGQCRRGAPACEHSNFAGSVVTYNYDRSETETMQRQCRAGGGLYRAP